MSLLDETLPNLTVTDRLTDILTHIRPLLVLLHCGFAAPPTFPVSYPHHFSCLQHVSFPRFSCVPIQLLAEKAQLQFFVSVRRLGHTLRFALAFLHLLTHFFFFVLLHFFVVAHVVFVSCSSVLSIALLVIVLLRVHFRLSAMFLVFMWTHLPSNLSVSSNQIFHRQLRNHSPCRLLKKTFPRHVTCTCHHHGTSSCLKVHLISVHPLTWCHQ